MQLFSRMSGQILNIKINVHICLHGVITMLYFAFKYDLIDIANRG